MLKQRKKDKVKKMGFFDKVKNMFTEEVEDDEVKVEQIKSDVKKVSIESPNVKQEDEIIYCHFCISIRTGILNKIFQEWY